MTDLDDDNAVYGISLGEIVEAKSLFISVNKKTSYGSSSNGGHLHGKSFCCELCFSLALSKMLADAELALQVTPVLKEVLP